MSTQTTKLGNTFKVNAVNPISTLTGGNAIQGFVKVDIGGTTRWIPFYDDPTT